jgi:hypothetical protein
MLLKEIKLEVLELRKVLLFSNPTITNKMQIKDVRYKIVHRNQIKKNLLDQTFLKI